MLAEHSLFNNISEKTLADLKKSSSERLFKKNGVIYLQDEPAQSFYLIKSGWVKLYRQTLDGEEAISDVLTAGDVFAENIALDEHFYTESAESVDDSYLVQIPVATFAKYLHEDPKLIMNYAKFISSKRKQKQREIEHLTVQTASQRIGCFLLRLVRDPNQRSVSLNLPYDKSLIASRLGMKAETFSRGLNKLRDSTNIEIIGSRVVIPDLASLSSYTCAACTNDYPCEDRVSGCA